MNVKRGLLLCIIVLSLARVVVAYVDSGNAPLDQVADWSTVMDDLKAGRAPTFNQFDASRFIDDLLYGVMADDRIDFSEFQHEVRSHDVQSLTIRYRMNPFRAFLHSRSGYARMFDAGARRGQNYRADIEGLRNGGTSFSVLAPQGFEIEDYLREHRVSYEVISPSSYREDASQSPASESSVQK